MQKHMESRDKCLFLLQSLNRLRTSAATAPTPAPVKTATGGIQTPAAARAAGEFGAAAASLPVNVLCLRITFDLSARQHIGEIQGQGQGQGQVDERTLQGQGQGQDQGQAQPRPVPAEFFFDHTPADLGQCASRVLANTIAAIVGESLEATALRQLPPATLSRSKRADAATIAHTVASQTASLWPTPRHCPYPYRRTVPGEPPPSCASSGGCDSKRSSHRWFSPLSLASQRDSVAVDSKLESSTGGETAEAGTGAGAGAGALTQKGVDTGVGTAAGSAAAPATKLVISCVWMRARHAYSTDDVSSLVEWLAVWAPPKESQGTYTVRLQAVRVERVRSLQDVCSILENVLKATGAGGRST